MTGIFRKLRKALALMLAFMMLTSSVASAAPTLTLPSMIKVIEDEAFKGDTSVENVVIPKGATTIGEEAFAGCTSLQSVTIPDSVTAIGENAFSGCGDVVIICSSTSYAAQYAAEKEMSTQFTDAAPIEMEWEQSIFDIYPANEGGMFGCVVLAARANGWDEAMHGPISWELERIDENQDVQIELYLPDYEGSAHAFVRMNESHATEGEATYRLTATAGAFSESHEFTVRAVPMPGDIPTGIGIHQDHYEIGDVLDFGKDDLYFVDGGWAMEDACVALSVPGVEEWPVWTENEAEFTDDGFRVTFTKSGSYLIPAWILVNNAGCYDEIAITVGNGVSDECFLNAGTNHTTLYLSEGDMGLNHWMADLNVANFENVADLPIEWQVEILEHDGEEPPVDAYINCEENKPWASLHSNGFTGSTGSVTFRVHCIVNGVDLWQDLTYTVENLPENLPTDGDVQVPQTEYQLNAGDNFEFKYSDIVLDESLLPEGMIWTPEIHNTWMIEEKGSSFEWTEEGFTVTFPQDGRFVFRAVAKLGANVYIGRNITVTVGTGVSPDFEITENFVTDTLYVGGHDSWIMSVGISGYTPPAGTDLVWKLEPAEGQGENLPVEAFNNGDYSDGQGYYEIMINANPMSDQPGTATWILKAVAGDEVVYEKELVLNLAAVPADMNLDMNVEQTVFNATVGEVFHYDFSNIQRGDNFKAPEGASVLRITYINEHFWNNESFTWVRGDEGTVGLEIVFDEPGRYMFESGVQVSNYTNVEQIVVIVDEGPELNMNWASDVLFNTMEGSAYIGELHLDNFFLHDGEYVNWEHGQISGDADVRLYIDDAWDEGRSIALRAELNSDATGTAVFEFSAHGFDGTEYTTQLVIAVMDGHVVLPGSEAISVPQETYELNVGDSLTFTVGDFTFDDSSFPEGYYYSKEVWGDDRIDRLEGFEWIDGGFTVTFTEPGRYEFRAAVRYSADCAVWKDVFVTVGNGGVENAELQCNYFVDALYPNGGERMQSSYELIGYNILSSDEVEWKLERYTDEYSPEDPITALYISWHSDDNRIVDITATVPSEVDEYVAEKYDLICCVNGVEVARERIYAHVYPTPENLPTELWVSWDRTHVNIGDVVAFNDYMFGPANGSIPEDVDHVYEIWVGDEMRNGGEFDEKDDGILFVPEQEGIYSFTAAIVIGNYTVEKQIVIVVGDGLNDEFGVNWTDNAFVLYQGTDRDDMWLTDAYTHDFQPAEGFEMNWRTYRVSEGDMLAEVYVESIHDGGASACFHTRRTSEQTGEEVWMLVGEINGNVAVEREVHVQINDLPENLPTAIGVENDNHQIQVGDAFDFTRDMFWLSNGEVPEGVEPYADFWIGNRMMESEGFEWIDNGFRFVPDEEGRYEFDVAFLLGNYQVSRRIVVTVGSGNFADFSIEERENAFQLYKGGHDAWVIDVYINNYIAPAQTELEWTLTLKEGQENPVVEPFLADEQYDGRGNHYVRVNANQISDESGETTWILKAAAGDEVVYERELVLSLADFPEEMIIDVAVDQVIFYADCGEKFTYSFDNISRGEKFNVPDDAAVCSVTYMNDYFWNNDSFSWIDGGFEVVFDEPGRYTFETGLQVNNHTNSVQIFIIVGEGPTLEPSYTEATVLSTFTGDCWVSSAYLHNFHLLDFEWIDWYVELLTETDAPVAEVYVNNTWDAGAGVNLHVRNVTGEAGEVTYRITGIEREGFEYSYDMTIRVVNGNVELPGSEVISFSGDPYLFEVGTEFHFGPEDIHVNEELIPEGFNYNKDFSVDDHLNGLDGAYWDENGFNVTFHEEGRYEITATVWLTADYRIERTVSVIIGDGGLDNAELYCHQYVSEVYPAGDEDAIQSDYELMNCNILSTDEVEWVLERQLNENSPEEPAVDLHIDWISEDNQRIDIRARSIREEYVTEEYLLTCRINGEAVASTTISVSVAETPEDLPAELWVDSESYHIDPWNEFVFTTEMFDIAGGAIPEGAFASKEIWTGDEMHNGGEYEDLENGFRFVPHGDGVFRFTAAYRINNRTLTKDITLIVGAGVDTDYSVNWDDNAFVLYRGHGENWMTNAFVHEFDMPEGWAIDWCVYPVDGEAYQPINIWVSETQDWGRFAGFMMSENGEECGESVWRIEAVVNGQIIAEREITVTLADLPENMPTELWVAEDVYDYYLEVGQEFVFTYDMFDVSNGVEPEGVLKRKELWVDDYFSCAEGFEWTENGIRFVPTHDGRYDFDVAVKYGSYSVSNRVTVTVGTGVHPDFSIDWEDNSFVIFKGGEWTWIANADIHNYAPPAGCNIDWFVECRTEGEDQVTNLRIVDIYNDGLSASFHGDPTSNQSGEDIWRIVAQAGEETIIDREITLTLTDLPETIPTDIWVERDDIHIEVGEEFVFDTTMFEVGEGEIPEGTRAYKFVDIPENVYNIYGFNWTENGGFYVKPDRDCRFSFKVAVEIGNHRIYRTITVTVGTGKDENTGVDWNEGNFTIYRNYEHNHDMWVMDAYIHDYTPPAGCGIEWNLERVSESELLDVYFGDIRDENCSANISAHINVHELGEETWRVKAMAGDEELLSREFTITIADLPETMPTELWVECDYHQINPGDEFSMVNGQFGLVGEAPEGMNAIQEFWLNESIENENEFEWIDGGGFRFRPMQDGTYTFEAAIRIANYAVSRTITVVVGSGVNPNFGVDWNEGSFTMYTGQNHDMWVMDAHIHDYDLPAGMDIEWYVEQGESDGGWETEAYIDNVWDDGMSANIYVRFADPDNQYCAMDNWRVIAKVGDEVIVERDFSVWIEELPEDIFTAPWVEQDYYEIQPGDEISMNYDQIGWDGGNPPEGARLDKHIWIPEQIGDSGSFEWTDNGFRFQPMEDGLYSFEIAISVGNYFRSKRIIVKVGSGELANQTVEYDENSTQLYKGGHDVWVMDVEVNNSVTGLEWTLTRENEEEPLYAEPFFVWVEGDGWGNYSLRVNANQMSEESGSNTWYLRASLGELVLIEKKIVLSLVDYPEEGGLNIDVAAVQTEFRVALGETFSYTFDNVQKGENFVMPDDAGFCRVIYMNDSIANNESFTWTDTGFEVAFSEPGRYVFEHGLQVNNYTEKIWITVIVDHDPWMDVHCKSDMVLSNCESGGWFAYVTLNDFHLVNDEWVEWRTELVTETENPVAELYVDNTQDGGRGANVHFRSVTGETGEATYRIIAYGRDGREYSTELTVRVVNADELELPGSEIIQIEQDYYHFDVDTEFNLGADCFTVNESLLPEGFGYYKELWGNDRIDGLWGTYWDDEGIHVYFGIEGRFELTAAVWITADYVITKPIVIEVGEISTENASLECVEYVNAIYPTDQEVYIGAYCLTGYDLVSTDSVEWEIVRFTAEYSPETPVIDLRIGWINDERSYVDIYAGPTHGEYGTELYDLICRVNGEEIARTGIEAHVLKAPENMPTELWTNADNDRHYINPWDVFEFHTWDFDISNGNYPEGVYTKKEVWVDEKLQSANGFEWLEDGGFRVQPDHDATYTFTAAVKIGNYCITRDVTLIVGAGDNSSYWVDWQDRACELYLHHGDIQVSGVYIHDYNLPEGMEVEWDVFRVDEDPSQVIEMYATDHRDGGLGVNLNARQDNGDCGMNVWRVIARVGDEVLLERDFELYVGEMPENMPADENIWVELDTYYLNVGDTLEFTEDQFGMDEGDYDMGGWWKEIWIPEEWNEQLYVDWYGHNAFRVTFPENGRYTFRVAMLKNNVQISREIRIIVGDGVPADAGLTLYQTAQTMYLAEGMMETGSGVDVRLEGYTVFEGEEFDWNVARISEGEPCVEARIGRISSDQTSVGLEFFNINAVGEETFEVTATTRDGGVFSTTFTMNVTDVAEGLPTDFDIGIGDHYEVGDFYLFTYDDVSLIGSDMTFDNVTLIDHGIQRVFGDENGVWWDDDGLNVNFHTEGVYELDTRIEIGNYGMEKTYLVTVGDGLRDDCHIQMEQYINTVYPGGDDHMQIAWAQLNNYTLLTGEEIEWTLTRINGSENNALELEFGDPWEYRANIHVCNLTGEEGWVEYELTGTADRYSEKHTIWVQVVNAPENLPTELWLENDWFELQVGDELVLNPYFWEVNGEIPEDAHVNLRYELNDRFNENAEVEWREDGGFTARLLNDGRYIITAALEINNYIVTCDIVVVVGDGVNEDMRLTVDQRFTTGFNYAENSSVFNSIASVRLDGYQLASGEEIEWTIELVEPSDSSELPVELSIDYLYDDTLTADIVMGNTTGATGAVTYKVTARTSFGQEFSENITYTIIEAPDTLPAEMTGVETEVQLNVGDTYVIDPSQIGFDGTVPDGVEYCLEFLYGIEYLEWLPGFVWREDGGFEVTFNRDGQFTYYIGYQIGTNHFVGKDVTITIGEGKPEEFTASAEFFTEYVLTGAEPGTEAHFADFQMVGYTPAEGEKIEWQVLYSEGNPNCVSLRVAEVSDDGTFARVNIVAGDHTAGEVYYMVGVATESGLSYFGECWAGAFDQSNMMVRDVWFDDVQMQAGEELIFVSVERMQMDGWYDGMIWPAYEIIPDDCLAAQESYLEYEPGVFGFTPASEGRYSITVRTGFGTEFFEDSFVLTVGDGIADDVHISADQHTDTIYLGGEENYLIGSVVLNNYNFIGDEMARWSIERIDENEGSPVEIHLNSRRDLCTLGFSNIQSTGSVTYRVTVETDAGFTDYADFTLNVVELPENLPTDFSFNLPTHYEVGETMRFVNSESVSFTDGEIPENAAVDVMVMDLYENPIWYENDCVGYGDGFEVNFGHDDRYQLEVRMKINNYVLARMVEITVGTGVSDDAFISMYLPTHRLYVNQGGSWLGNFYLYEHLLFSGETVEWTLECIDGNDEAGLYLDGEWDGGLGINLNSAGTGEAAGWSAYRLTAKTDAFEQTLEFGISVEELPEGMPTALTGMDEILVLPDCTSEINAEWYVQPEWESPDGNYIRYIIDADESLQAISGFEWIDEKWFRITPSETGEYTITVRGWIGNYQVGEKQIALSVRRPSLEVCNAGSILYPYDDYNDEKDMLWVADASLVDVPTGFENEVEWTLEQVVDYHVPSLYMEFGDMWDEGRSVKVMGGYEGSWYTEVESNTYRLIARIGDVFEESVELTVTLGTEPEDLPNSLSDNFFSDVYYMNVGDFVTFESSWIIFEDGTVPEDALVYDEIWSLEDGIALQDDFQYWEHDNGTGGVGFSVTFNKPGRYHFYVVRWINNYCLKGEVCIVVGDVQLTDLPWEIEIGDTLYTDCDYCEFFGSISLEPSAEFTFFDDDWLSVEITRITDDNSPEEPLVELYNGDWYWYREGDGFSDESLVYTLNTGSTGTATGTEKYRVVLMCNYEEIAAFDVTLNVVEKPADLPTQIYYKKGYLLNRWGNYEPMSPGCFEVRLDDFGLCTDDSVVVDAYDAKWEMRVYGDEEMHDIVWHEDGKGFDMYYYTRPDGYGSDHRVCVWATINNYQLMYNLPVYVDGGSPK